MRTCIDLTGCKFNFYRVIERAPNCQGRSSAFWRCICECGNERIVRGDILRRGEANSCGCRKTSAHRLKRIFDRKYKIQENGCWIWQGSRCKDGYGNLGDLGKKAHRYSYERFKGEIPKGVCVCHSCDDSGCVNPRHLFLGTQAQNVEDRVKKGRSSSKLNKDVVLKIRLAHSEGNVTKASLAREYGVNHTTIRNIINRETWKHV